MTAHGLVDKDFFFLANQITFLDPRFSILAYKYRRLLLCWPLASQTSLRARSRPSNNNTAAMTDNLDKSEVATAMYEELVELEREFEDVEAEIIRQQVALTKKLYEKRATLVAKIPNFWPLVLEQAPPDIDQYIHPADSAVLLSSLTSISVSHFEIDGGKGDPRSVAIKMEFAENEWFEDKVLEKKFWYRLSKDVEAGLVSEPVPIKWKEGKDLTHGMLDLVVKIWEQDKKRANRDSTKIKKEADYTPDEKALKEKIEATGIGAVSFFGWFGYRGLDVSAEESRLATEEDRKKRADRAAGKVPEPKNEPQGADEGDEDEDDDPLALEVFPDGDELALAISEDLWPNALKYFTNAQEADYSDVDFEDGDDEDDEEMADDDNDDDEEKPKGSNAVPPAKKRKA
ncbi:nucleosome assembly protein-domain-containing protein [Durotheca rogersii]|uniref:nucleosome assembly protein-domain-containing protein n=1 Tax=Durotheca rogersii TaxID=419775 RepID=UPI00221FF08F|nr:nucleosome assembly protein-domain-containing protein [Durotheca rogersii]KAI5865582.1 nucleosome assembly protein-domain-containing protein [Durotheca rogersii]